MSKTISHGYRRKTLKTCAQKVTYQSRREAERYADTCLKKYNSTQYAYLCPYCVHFHLTTSPQQAGL